MRVRVRKIRRRLKVSIRDAERVNDRPRTEHIASLGAIAVDATAHDRAMFWHSILERLGRLSNRIGPADHEAILAALAWRVPNPTAEELMAERPPLTFGQAAAALGVLARAARRCAHPIKRNASPVVATP